MSDAFETEKVQEQFVAGAMITGAAYNRDEARGWFAEWLAQVRAEAQVEVLTDVAGSFFARTHDGMPNGRAYNSYTVARIVREVADRIAREAGIETGGSND